MKAAIPTIGALHNRVRSGSGSDATTPGCCKSQRGRALAIGGNATKLEAGGGDDVAHSNVHAFHGLSPANLPRRKVRRPSQSSTITPMPIRNAPMVSAKLSAPQPGRSGYVYVRRG